MEESKVTKHPSFGNITVCRTQGGVQYLFGSEARHHHMVHVEINTAELHRDLSHDWVFASKRLLEFYMTESQWAHFVSSFSDGSGTPITLRYVNGEGIEPCPPPADSRTTFAEEVKDRVNDAVGGLRKLRERLAVALEPGNKTIGKRELLEVLRTVDGAVMQITNNLPYVEKCFNDSMEKKMTNAKIEFEAIVASRLQEMGLETLRKSLPESSFEQKSLPETV